MSEPADISDDELDGVVGGKITHPAGAQDYAYNATASDFNQMVEQYANFKGPGTTVVAPAGSPLFSTIQMMMAETSLHNKEASSLHFVINSTTSGGFTLDEVRKIAFEVRKYDATVNGKG